MSVTEVAIWPAMLGGLLTLAALALGDATVLHNTGASRNLLFILTTGAACAVMVGLPQFLFPALSGRLLAVLKAGLGPTAGAMGLYFVGTWLGGVREDVRVHRITTWGACILLLAAFALAVLASQIDLASFPTLLLVAGLVNLVPVLLAMVAVTRAARLGDPLAPWMLPAIACLAGMTIGHYLNALALPGLGTGFQLFTAVVTVVFFLIASALVALRDRERRQLARLARLEPGTDPATGLHTGAALVTDVEHVFWRTARMHGECTVVCLYLSNLYALTDSAGIGIENQILTTVAARIRRAAGFRCVVGLYHPRCFVVVIHTDQHQGPMHETLDRLRELMTQPLAVTGEDRTRQVFRPHMGMGICTADPTQTPPLEALNAAEHEAMAHAALPGPLAESDVPTVAAPLL